MRGYDVNNEEFLYLPAVLCVIVGPPQLCLETKEHRQFKKYQPVVLTNHQVVQVPWEEQVLSEEDKLTLSPEPGRVASVVQGPKMKPSETLSPARLLAWALAAGVSQSQMQSD